MIIDFYVKAKLSSWVNFFINGSMWLKNKKPEP
jgi:hypothetical protein